ncbi:MAG TPA: dienelactone hydrolase family protein [Tepidisphaeraceae bacterium]|nr:dienelactone hydrolase family protein [Tepidisphaeraceae bacterium]
MKSHLAAALLLATALASFTSAAIKTETVEYKQGDTTLKGFLAYDDALADKRPAVIIVHEWWGLTDYTRRRAHDVASLGYVAFVADMFGEGKTTNDPKEAGAMAGAIKKDPATGMARAQAALDFVKSQPLVDGERVAAMGYCFGGTIALEMARAGMPLLGVVSFHGSLSTDNPAEAGKLKAKVLALHGADDPMVPPEEVLAFAKEMQQADADWQLVVYGNAVHSFTNPKADTFGIPGVKYNAAADRRSWEDMKDFLAEVFRGAANGAQAKAAAKPNEGGVYYIGGYIARPGAYEFSGGRAVTLMQAITAAGGLDPKDLRDVKILLNRGKGANAETSEFDYEKLKQDAKLDVALLPNDRVLIKGE